MLKELRITVLMGKNGNGETRSVWAEIVGPSGRWAVHRQVVGWAPNGPGWVVTHVPSGLAMWKTRDREGVMAVAVWLENQGSPPPELTAPEDLVAWSRASPDAKKLARKMEQLAPRWRAGDGEEEP